MKEFLVGLGLIMVSSFFMIYQYDYHRHQEEIYRLKSIGEEVAAAGAQYFNRERFSEGFYEFNATEGLKASKSVLKASLYLNDDLSPKAYSYWSNVAKVKYKIDFISSNNVVTVEDGMISSTVDDTAPFPKTYTFNHYGVEHSSVLFGPSVIVTVFTGKANYTLVDILERGDNYRTSIHTFEE